jgi:hypothetical protein
MVDLLLVLAEVAQLEELLLVGPLRCDGGQVTLLIVGRLVVAVHAWLVGHAPSRCFIHLSVGVI